MQQRWIKCYAIQKDGPNEPVRGSQVTPCPYVNILIIKSIRRSLLILMSHLLSSRTWKRWKTERSAVKELLSLTCFSLYCTNRIMYLLRLFKEKHLHSHGDPPFWF